MATLTWYYKRRKQILSQLGGVCIKCGKDYDLQVDHIDHTKKNFNVLANWSISWVKLAEELKLCQLLCKSCHLNKSLEEGSFCKGESTKPKPIKHGTLHAYCKYKCRCVDCKRAKAVIAKKTYNRKLLHNLK